MNLRTAAAAIAASSLLLGACAADVEDALDDLGSEAADLASEGEDMLDDMASEMDDMNADASVSFTGVADGDTVTSPLTVGFEATGFDIVAAGEAGDSETAGHMHVMIDVDCVAVGEVIPADDNHVHFGDGSTTADLELSAGEHTLCLQAGDDAHAALDVTQTITITVE